MADLEKNHPSIRALGCRFKLTQVEFWIDYDTGLPFDEEPNVLADAAERPEEDNGSDLITTWLELCKKDVVYMLGEQDLAWQPPPDLDNPAFVYISKDASTTDVNPMGPELTADSVDRLLSVGNIEGEDVLMQDFFEDINKYWFERYILFSKYDAGIKMDKEGWFSATPQCIAEHHASRCGKGVVIDCFTGVGGNAIRFAPISTHVIAIDIDPKKIEYAEQNAAVYGVEDNIDFITGDCFILAKNLKADTVFLSPPWGGPEYALEKIFDMKTMLKPCDGQSLFNVAKEIAPKVVMFLPRNVDLSQLADLSLSASPPWTLEVEKNFINGRLKAITAYFTDPSLTLPEAKKPDREAG